MCPLGCLQQKKQICFFWYSVICTNSPKYGFFSYKHHWCYYSVQLPTVSLREQRNHSFSQFVFSVSGSDWHENTHPHMPQGLPADLFWPLQVRKCRCSTDTLIVHNNLSFEIFHIHTCIFLCMRTICRGSSFLQVPLWVLRCLWNNETLFCAALLGWAQPDAKHRRHKHVNTRAARGGFARALRTRTHTRKHRPLFLF